MRHCTATGSLPREPPGKLHCTPRMQVGSGKSSILAALLGELQPLRSCGGGNSPQNGGGTGGVAESADGVAGATTSSSGDSQSSDDGPLVVGSVAYCSQVPWVAAGTVQVILWGCPCVHLISLCFLSSTSISFVSIPSLFLFPPLSFSFPFSFPSFFSSSFPLLRSFCHILWVSCSGGEHLAQ